jgi:hypothetical protein
MYVSLLIVGTAIVAAGIALVGSGVSIQDHTFDPAVITPGAVAIVGGLTLVGLAFVLQQLRNIEKAIARRPVVNPVRSEVSEVTLGSVAGGPSADPAIPVPSKVAVEPLAEPEQSAAAPALATPAAQEAERLREKFPSLLRLDSAPGVEESEVSILPKSPVSPARSDEEVAEVKNVVSVRQLNGGGAGRSAPRLDTALQPNGRSDRIKNFDSFWPKRKRPGQAAPAVAVRTAVPEPSAVPALPIESARSAEPESVVEALAPETPMPVSILKSGVVDGMAYTLYSDGSIEAQLPQGTLRFGSITELRNHIEQSA